MRKTIQDCQYFSVSWNGSRYNVNTSTDIHSQDFSLKPMQAFHVVFFFTAVEKKSIDFFPLLRGRPGFKASSLY